VRVAVSQLARVRERRGYSQRGFAAALGLSPSTLSGVENLHQRPWPKLRAAAARLLDVPEATLFPADEQPPVRQPGASVTAGSTIGVEADGDPAPSSLAPPRHLPAVSRTAGREGPARKEVAVDGNDDR
jgi:transcriptional regulator with XRE-family HTH domain